MILHAYECFAYIQNWHKVESGEYGMVTTIYICQIFVCIPNVRDENVKKICQKQSTRVTPAPPVAFWWLSVMLQSRPWRPFEAIHKFCDRNFLIKNVKIIKIVKNQLILVMIKIELCKKKIKLGPTLLETLLITIIN